MKCAECGSLNPARSVNCLNCGASLVIPRTEISNESVPEWRKEVTRKAREFGERKKTLTTPPNPLKTSVTAAPEEPAPENRFHRPERPRPPVAADPVKPPEPVKSAPSEPLKLERIEPSDDELPSFEKPIEPSKPMPAPTRLDPVIPIPSVPPQRPVFPLKPQPEYERVEIDNSTGYLPFEDEEEHHPGLMLGARSISFVIDNLIFAGAAYLVIFICKQFLGFDLLAQFKSSWLPAVSVLLILHCLYYVYFYKTSRQTPGQVFFALEVRDLAGGTVSFGKAISRWAALVFLNIFNFVPLFSGRDFLLLDYLSGTEVRSLKNR